MKSSIDSKLTSKILIIPGNMLTLLVQVEVVCINYESSKVTELLNTKIILLEIAFILCIVKV